MVFIRKVFAQRSRVTVFDAALLISFFQNGGRKSTRGTEAEVGSVRRLTARMLIKGGKERGATGWMDGVELKRKENSEVETKGQKVKGQMEVRGKKTESEGGKGGEMTNGVRAKGGREMT